MRQARGQMAIRMKNISTKKWSEEQMEMTRLWMQKEIGREPSDALELE